MWHQPSPRSPTNVFCQPLYRELGFSWFVRLSILGIIIYTWPNIEYHSSIMSPTSDTRVLVLGAWSFSWARCFYDNDLDNDLSLSQWAWALSAERWRHHDDDDVVSENCKKSKQQSQLSTESSRTCFIIWQLLILMSSIQPMYVDSLQCTYA